MGLVFKFNFKLDSSVDFLAWWWNMLEWQSAHPNVEAKDYDTWGSNCKLQEEREVFGKNVGNVFGDLPVFDYVLRWLDRWVVSWLDRWF